MDKRQKKYKEAIEALVVYLGEDGKEFFNEMIEEHGEIAPVFMEDGYPHSVHFREGMAVRNFLRGLEQTNSWSSHDFDNKWVEMVEEAIK